MTVDSKQHSVSQQLRSTGRHSIIYGIGSIAQSAIGLVLLPILTSLLSAEEFGAYSLIVMASTVAGAIFYFGMTSALPRSYFDYQSDDDRRAVFTTAFLILAAGAVIQSVAGFAAANLIAKVLFREIRYADAIGWALLASAMAFVNQYFFGYLRILQKSTSAVIFSLASLVLGVVTTLVFLRNGSGDRIAAVFHAMTLTQGVVGTAFVIVIGPTSFSTQLKKEEYRHLLTFGLATVFAAAGYMLLEWGDRLIIERFTSLDDVGLYSGAVRVGSLINVVLITPFSQIWAPMMMEHRADPHVRQLFSRILTYFVFAGALVLAGAALFAGDIVPILIRSQAVAPDRLAQLVMIVMLGYFAYGTTNIFAAGIFYERKIHLLPAVYFAVAILKLLVGVVVVNQFGIIGAAIVSLVAYMIIPLIIYLLACKYFSFSIDWKRIMLAILWLAAPLTYGLFGGGSLALRILAFMLLIVVAYWICLNKNERKVISNFVRRIGNPPVN